MAIISQISMFQWKNVLAESDLDRLQNVLRAIPDEALMRKLEKKRGKGRNDFPVRAIWNSLLAMIVFQHPSIESLRRELSRNGQLRDLCGFDPISGGRAVPTAAAYTRFLKSLMAHEPELSELFEGLVERLTQLLPDFGSRLAIDSKAIRSFGKPTTKKEEDGRRDNNANWGKKTYYGVDKEGKAWKKSLSWFGYKVHLVVDSNYELPVAFKVTKASDSDSPELLPMVKALKRKHAELLGRAKVLTADRGYDSKRNNKELYRAYRIAPVIDIRKMWKEGEQQADSAEKTRSLFTARADNIIYDCKGLVQCVCPKSGECRAMAFAGFEKDRQTLKYKCPSAAYGLECAGRAQCGFRPAKEGRCVRIPLEKDFRIFTPIARSSYKWQREYNHRTAVERVNSRLDVSFGFELHTIRGIKKLKTRMALALSVMLALAVGSVQAGVKEQMRSLVRPLPLAA